MRTRTYLFCCKCCLLFNAIVVFFFTDTVISVNEIRFVFFFFALHIFYYLSHKTKLPWRINNKLLILNTIVVWCCCWEQSGIQKVLFQLPCCAHSTQLIYVIKVKMPHSTTKNVFHLTSELTVWTCLLLFKRQHGLLVCLLPSFKYTIYIFFSFVCFFDIFSYGFVSRQQQQKMMFLLFKFFFPGTSEQNRKNQKQLRVRTVKKFRFSW